MATTTNRTKSTALGATWPDERVAVLLDRNRRCDAGDEVAWAPPGRDATTGAPMPVTGEAMAAVCAALTLEDTREP